MLRKRTSFKPNLNQPTSTPPKVPSSAPTEKQATPETTHRDVPKEDNIPDEVSNHVQEAIKKLTGQKFEPLKLSSCVNKHAKIKDLLFINPSMTKHQKKHKKNIHLETKKVREPPPEVITEVPSSTIPEEEPNSVPQVKMGADGKLILDESSLVINTRNTIRDQEAIVEDDEDIFSRTNYESFRTKSSTSQTKWSVDETQKFYHALTIFGTDFSVMESLLFSGSRTRTELHKKFKREERLNKPRVDIALSNRISLSSEELEELKETFFQ